MRHTLITGAPGWLGNRLVEVLTNPHHELQRYSNFTERNVRCLILPSIDSSAIDNFLIKKISGDILNIQSLKEAMKGVETVFHLVGIIHPKKVGDFYKINRDGLKNVLEAATQAKVKRIVIVSSNSPAGVNKKRSLLLHENDTPNPYKHYGKSKLEAEKLALDFHKRGDIEVVIIRPCWFYGPGQPARQTRFFEMIKKGKPLIFGDGKNLRSMSYLDNTIQGLLLAESSEKAPGNIYWIADKKPYTTLEIYQTIASLLQTNLKPRFIPRFISWGCEQVDTILQSFNLYSTDFHVAGEMVYDIACSIEKAQNELGYNPTIDLREGMRRSIEWCNSQGKQL